MHPYFFFAALFTSAETWKQPVFTNRQVNKENVVYIQWTITKPLKRALAGVAQRIEHQPENQRVTSSIPSQDMCLGCGPGPQLWAHERQLHNNVSLPLFLPPLL